MAYNVQNLASLLAGGTTQLAQMSESDLRKQVDKKILSKLTPHFEIKPIHSYKFWAGQFAYTLGQIVEVVSTEFIDDDISAQQIMTFKTSEELEALLPYIQKEYTSYL